MAAASIHPGLRFRGKSYLALVLAPTLPLEDWLKELVELGTRSPGFFSSRSVVLDVTGLPLSAAELASLLSRLSEHGIRPMGIEGAQDVASLPGMPPFLAGGRTTADIEMPKSKKRAAPAPASLTVDAVRSGQSVIFPDGDVTIIGSVASGAEVIAGGSVHVYGTLRGRIIAGAYGNAHARIFCRKLQAEFLAIDAVYLTAEAIDTSLAGQPVQAWSEHEAIKLAILR
ncbi:septum site-determining protein MinC [Terrihabitans sp. B22-R8]|uniref:septum site-determining protein MinC n=1 Tax=Terrihabitans sp. B22-R8 TaxID=3425128 RepID=UPI00403CD265